MDAVKEVWKSVPVNQSNIIDNTVWFDMVQTQGNEMNVYQLDQYKKNPKKRFHTNTAHDEKLYPDLWKLAVKVHDHLCKNRKDYPRLASNKSDARHFIGDLIAKHRRIVNRADINGVNDMLFHLEIIKEVNKDKNVFYYLSQDEMEKVLLQKWGISSAMNMQISVNEKVRLFGIIFNSADLREYLPDLCNKSLSGNRRALDAARSRKAAAIKVLCNRFIDDEVVVSLPQKWTDPATAINIDKQMGDGTYEEHGKFDPNNLNRIKLPWQEHHIKTMFALVQTEYNKSMDKYTKGTGGGSGDDVNYSSWQYRDETRLAGYSEQQNQLYLTLIYMWDKEHGYAFVTTKDKLPEDCGREDDDDIIKTPTTGKSEDDNIMMVIRNLSSERAINNRQLMDVMKGNDDSIGDIVSDIAKTNEQIDKFEIKLQSLEEKKRMIKQGSGSSSSKKKQAKIVKEDIKNNTKMVGSLKKTLEEQRKQLATVNHEENNDNINSSDSNSSGYEST